MNADSVKIECDEDGLHLIIDGDSPDPGYTASILDYRIQDIDLDRFYENVRNTVGGYLRERDEARRTAPSGVVVAIREDGTFRCDPDESGGYDLSDPKHPDFHSIHADLYDQREGK